RQGRRGQRRRLRNRHPGRGRARSGRVRGGRFGRRHIRRRGVRRRGVRCRRGRRGGREGGRRLGDGVLDGGAQFGRLGVRELAVVRLQHGVEELGDRSEDAAETGHAADLLEQRVGFRYGRLGRHVGAVPGRVAVGRDGGRSGDTQDERGAERGGRDTAGGQ